MQTQKTKTCDTCGEDRQVTQFRAESPTCIPCLAAQQQAELKAELEARKQERAAEKKAAQRERQNKAARERAERKARSPEAKAQREANALSELAARTLARRHLLPFIQRFQQNYQAGWVHKDICLRLEKFSQEVQQGLSPRLMLQMPPRLGKSTIASHYFPSWHLGNYPSHEIITSSYSGSLAMGFSRKARTVVGSKKFNAVFEACRLDRQNMNAEGWMTTKGGGFVPAGVGGAITGKGAHVLIIDDPVKNAEEAESETIREATWDWYTSTAYTRLAPGGGVLVIQTRWHLDDLSGRLEEKMTDGNGDEWEIVRYPAIAVENEKYREKGEALHPERYDEQAYERIKKAVGPRVWAALYQQNPVADEGSYFNEGMFVPCKLENIPKHCVNYSAWDFAISKKERADWTAGITVGVDHEEDIWLKDLVHAQMGTYEIVEAILESYLLHKPRLVGIEDGAIKQAIDPVLEKEIADRAKKGNRSLYELAVEPLKPGNRDKELRARPIQGRCQQRKVHIPIDAPWFEAFLAEVLSFPHGKHDDIVDAFAWIGQMLLLMDSPADPGVEKPAAPGWLRKLKTLTIGSNGRAKDFMGA
jgi:predicted phage terminase large subunit-like protein